MRSKGVAVYFVTQNPLDVPDSILSQFGNRVRHALRSFTPRDARAVKTAVETFRQNPELDTETVITELSVGEALVSTLEDKGVPSIVQRTLTRPPSSCLGPIDKAERAAAAEEREQASEQLGSRVDDSGSILDDLLGGATNARTTKSRGSSRRRSDSAGTARIKSVARSVGTQLGRALVRGILGSLTRR